MLSSSCLPAVVFALLLGTSAEAFAACDTTTASTSGVSIAFTSINQTYHLCVSNDQVLYGLLTQNHLSSNFNAPVGNATTDLTVAGQLLNYAPYTYATSKATYYLNPVQGTALIGASEYDITLLSVASNSVPDTMTLWYSSLCSDSGTSCSGPTTPSGSAIGYTDTSFTITVTSLPAPPGPSAATAIANTFLTRNFAATSFTPVTGSGGTAPLSYTVAPSLPAGLSMNSTTGAIRGTPTVASSSASYTVTVKDASNATATANFNLTVNSAVTATQSIASVTLTQNKAVTSFTPVTGGGGTTPLSYGISPSLPAGLSLNTGTGAITGTPTGTSSSASYTVTVTDANGATASNTFSLAVNSAVTATQSVASTVLTQNHAATSFTPVTGGGGTTPLSYGVSPALPSGLSLDSTTGAVTGTPTVTHPISSFTVTVTDANNATASNTFSLTVNSAVVATQAVASTAVTVNHIITSFTPVTGSGGTGSLAYGVSPSLPAGLSFNTSNGAVTGTPTSISSAASYTVTVTDTNNATATASFSLAVNGPVAATQAIASTTLTQNKAATSFTPVTGSGGTTPLSYGVSPGLPTGLSFNTSTGAITGTPTVTSSSTSYTVTVTDANSATATAGFSLAVNPAVTATQAIASTALTQNKAATSFTPVTGGGGTSPLSYGVSPALPSGLSINSSTGTISGTPTAASGATTYTVTATDANNATASNTFSLTVNSAVVATQAVASTAVTVNHIITSFTPVTGSGGTGSLSYGVSPSLPAGLSFNTANGAVTGTPTVVSAAASYTVTVTDTNNATATASFSLAVNGAVTATQAIASKTLTQNKAAISFTPVTGSGGTTPLSYGVSPALPTGLNFDTTTGAVTGTPTVTHASSSFTVSVTDVNNATSSASFSLTVNPAVVATQAIGSVTLTANHAPTPFTPVTGSGGTSPLSYGVSPSLPAGLSINSSTGAISGTPTAASGAANYTVTVTDANNATATAIFSLTVNGVVTATQAIPSTGLTVNHAATSFTPVTGSGGTGSLTYGVSPTLPAGLSFNTTTGAVTGTPTSVSSATSYTVTVTDTNNATATASFSLAVNGAVTATQAIASTTLTLNHAATSFTPVTGGGGTAPLSYGVSPSLPAGLNFSSSTGAITGTPTATHVSSSFTVTVTDANSATATASFSLAVNPGVTATTAVPTTILTANHAATSFTPVTGGGGLAPLSYGVSPTLPAGLSINSSTGTISGTPTASIGATTFTVTVTDANSATATATFSLTVNGAVTATTAIPSTVLVVNQAATGFTPVTGSGGTGALSYAVAPALPAGLTFNTASGAISGTPTVPTAATSFTVTVTDGNSASATANFSLSVGVIATTVALASSQNPSSFGQSVTFTATVTGTGTPTGNVTFNDGGVAIGTGALSAGVATFTTSTLATGSHTITASYAGNVTFGPSTSQALAQTVNIPADSVRLRALQLNVTKVVSQNSGQAISSAIDDAIAEGFSDDNGTFVTPGHSALRFNFAAYGDDRADQGNATNSSGPRGNAYSAPGSDGTGRSGRGRQGSSRIDDAFAAINQQMPGKAPPKKFREEKDWLFWVDVRGSGIDRWGSPTTTAGNAVNQATLHGLQVNALMGLTYKAALNLLLGVVGGYETFNYTEQDINGKLTGQGWTVGSYLGWKITPTLRYDAAVTYSGIGYDGTAGTAQGNFNGQRWLVSTGLTGNYNAAGFFIEPSARVYALWEKENAYVDSLGTQQSSHDFATGRASSGVKVTYPVRWIDGVLLAPYLGVYGDYYFTQDDASSVLAAGGAPLASMPLLQGWSARVTGGVGAKLPGGATLGIGAQYGGIGGNTQIWTATAKAQIPF